MDRAAVAPACFVPARILPRNLLVGITYVVVIFSIIVQGLSIGPLVKKLGLSTSEAPADAEH